MGKVQFHQKGGLIHKARKKENLLTGNMDPDKNLFMKLKQFREQRQSKKTLTESSSELERKVNALASGAEEGRDKLR